MLHDSPQKRGENMKADRLIAFESWALLTKVATAPVTFEESPFFLPDFAIAEFF